MKKLKQLMTAGLTKVETKVYLTLLEKGPSLSGEISRKSGVHRRTVYDLLERLVAKGLVVYIKQNNQRVYECVHPKRFMELLKEKESALNSVMAELTADYETSKDKKETVFFRGTSGLKSVFEDQLAIGKEILVISGSPREDEILKYYFPHYNRERTKRKIKVKLLYDGKHKGKIEKKPLTSVKFLPKGYGSFAATNIYGDKVAIILWVENPFAIVIRQKEIAQGYRKNFELLWKMASES